jgi:lactoylglutathione lyase/glyoxylase I family protein
MQRYFLQREGVFLQTVPYIGVEMTRNKLFSEAQVHHVALRVADADASKVWFLTKLDFRIDREFSFRGMNFVWMRPPGSESPIIELIGGAEQVLYPQYEYASESHKPPGFHHLCLQVDDAEQVVAELRRRDVKIVIDVTAGAPGSGVEKAAFIADPWGNMFELLELPRSS